MKIKLVRLMIKNEANVEDSLRVKERWDLRTSNCQYT